MDDGKKLFYEHADVIPNWKSMTRSELCFLCLDYKENNNPLWENCLSGIIYKFWNVISHNYYTQKYKIATLEDCYEWLVNGISYVLDHHVWTDPNSSLYGDENAPEKAINVKVYSEKINFYVARTRQKRKLDSDAISLDEISEDASDDYFIPIYDENKVETEYLNDVVRQTYERAEFLHAFMLDAILYDDLVDKVIVDGVQYAQFNKKKLKKRLKNYDLSNCKVFSETYGYDLESVIQNAEFMKRSLSDKAINKFLQELRHYGNAKELRQYISTY